MGQNTEEIQKTDHMQEEEKSPDFKNAEILKSEDQFKTEINRVANDSWKKGFISKESYDFYMKLSLESKEDSQQNIEILKNMYKYSREHHDKASVINRYFEQAKKNGYMSVKDEQFLMSKIVHQPEFVSQFSTAERLIKEKINRMKKDKETYNQIVNHKIVKNIGCLQIDKNIKINIPNEKKFLEMKVPERRELLEKLQKSLPEAEKYAEKLQEEESYSLENNYKSLLENAYKQDKIIGLKTYKKFWDGFQKIDNQEKKYWIKEFDNEIKRYEKLWNEIRYNLKADELKKMEDSRDKMGYTELFSEYGEIKKSLDDKYEKKLNVFIIQGIIGVHVKNEFMSWIKDRDPKKKYEAIDKMHDKEGGQMERYKKIWDEIRRNLSKDQKIFMESKRDIWGYNEIKNQYDQFFRGEKSSSEEKKDPLSTINSTAVKTAIIRTNIDLKKRGQDKRKTFLNRLSRMLGSEKKDQFDITDFQSDLRNNRGKKEDNNPNQVSEKNISADNIIDIQKRLAKKRSENINQITQEIKPKEQARFVKEDGFKQIKTSEDDGHIHRKAQLEINRTKGMEQFFIEDGKQEFRSREDGGRDNLSLAVHADDGRTVDLDLNEIRAMKKYLEEEQNADLDKTA